MAINELRTTIDKYAALCADDELVKAAIRVTLEHMTPMTRTPERAQYLKDIIQAAAKRSKGYSAKRLIGMLGANALAAGSIAAGSSAAAPILSGLALLTILGAATIAPKIQDAKTRKALQEALGPEKGEEIANLSQRVYNKSRKVRGLFATHPISFLGDINEGRRREEAAVNVMQRLENLLLDPATRVGPYSTRS